MQRLAYPFPLFLDQHGDLLDAGRIYVGVEGNDPETSPITIYWDAEGTIPAAQPLRTRGGLIVNNGAPAVVYVPDGDYSQRVRDADGNQVSYTGSVNATLSSTFQPLNDILTAISALAAEDFGLGVLTAADAAAARSYLGIVDALAKVGGTVTGNILRNGAGPHLYHMTNAFVSGRVFVTDVGAADPTSQDGDIWLEAAS